MTILLKSAIPTDRVPVSRPLAFTDDLVLATRRRQKTETRRIAKIDLPTPDAGFAWNFQPRIDDPQLWDIFQQMGPCIRTDVYASIKCPYGVPGDLIWMRERWGFYGLHTTTGGGNPEKNWITIKYHADDAKRDIYFENHEEMYAAPPHQNIVIPPEFAALSVEDRLYAERELLDKWWKAKRSMSPRFMPKYAARTILKIGGIGLDFVKNIRPEDIWREGIGACPIDPRFIGKPKTLAAYNFAAWEKKWDSIYAPQGKPHSANPLVWIIKYQAMEVL